MPFSVNMRMASMTVAVSGRLYTSCFMMDSSSVRRWPSTSFAAASLRRCFTNTMVRMAPNVHRMPPTKNAALMPCRFAWNVSVYAICWLATMVLTETRMAVPSEPATWRSVLFTDVPWFTSSSGSAFMAHVVIGMLTRESVNRRTV